MEDILLSPSGNVIGQVGPGALIRMAEGERSGSQSITTALTEVLPDGGGVGLRVAISNPTAGRDYRAECEFDIGNGTSQAKGVVVKLDVSYDLGATWNLLGTVNAEQQVVAAGSTHVHMRAVLGALPAFPAVAPASALVRGTIAQPTGDTGTATILKAYMSFEEHART